MDRTLGLGGEPTLLLLTAGQVLVRGHVQPATQGKCHLAVPALGRAPWGHGFQPPASSHTQLCQEAPSQAQPQSRRVNPRAPCLKIPGLTEGRGVFVCAQGSTRGLHTQDVCIRGHGCCMGRLTALAARGRHFGN